MARTPSLLPILSAGRHRSPRQGACFMEFASYLAGERWSDHPACTHPLLAALARDVNDLTSDRRRDRLMPLVHRVIGLNGDDPRIAIAVAIRAAAHALPIASMERQRALATGLLALGADTDAVRDAFATTPDSERWARAYLARTPARPRNTERAAYAMVHTAVVGIALACVDDPDARLRALLADAIADVERMLGTAAAERSPVLTLA
ncbi:MAG TPA: hypothetical protein VN200_01190 [Rhodoglobus sp.]|nr:hypothetical protein [Rhodoglobus sp.]